MKRLLFLIILLFTIFFSISVIAQELGSLRKGYEISIPEKIQSPLGPPLPAGTYTVGTGGYFPTIDSAFKKLSIDGIAGEIVLELIDELYVAPTTLYGYLLNGPIPGSSSRVTIKPAANKNVVIESSGGRAFTFINTNYVTCDGVALTGETTLTFHTFQNTVYLWNDGIDFIFNSDHNVIQNINFIDEDFNRGGGGIGFWNPSSSAFACDSNLAQNNFIKASGIAIYVAAFNNSSVRPKGNIIRGNIIGSETDSLIGYGIQVEVCQNTIIEKNIVQNVRYFNRPNVGTTRGINSYNGSGDIIRDNIVHNIAANGDWGSTGILLSGESGYQGNNNQVYNNMVYDIQSTSVQTLSRVAGIQVWNQINPKIYYNSVYLSGNGNGANSLGSAALFIYSGVVNSDIKNNILVNTRNESPFCASSIYDYSTSNLTSNYNDLYYEFNPYNCLVRVGSSDYHTLADWQAAGKDLNSVNEIVNFTSPTDLHINNNFYTKLDGYATPIAGIDTDFDGQPRNSLLPDIGADEFDLAVNATNWQMQNSNFPASVYLIDLSAVNNQVCWAVAQKYPAGTIPYAGYLRTTDGGSNWVCDTIHGISNGYFQQIFAIDADTAYATVYVNNGESSKGVYKTTDAGTTWNRQNAFNTSLYGPGYIHFFDSQNGVVIGDPNLETYTTTNGGLTWNPVIMPPTLTDEITWLSGNGIEAIDSTIWFCTGARLFKSTDRGYTWTIMVSEPQYIRWFPCIAFHDSQNGIYSLKKQGTATDHLFRKTTDGGFTWNTISNSILDNIAPTSLQHIPGTEATYIVSGGRNPGMNGTAITADAGASWNLIDNEGKLYIIFPSIYVGWGSQWETNIVQKYVGPNVPVEDEQIDEVPTGYMLSQNYPNPFNPTTIFRYSIPNESKVIIKVYDIIGREVETLVNGEKATGTYELTWNAANLSSGVYFYQLKAGDFISVKKMLLLK